MLHDVTLQPFSLVFVAVSPTQLCSDLLLKWSKLMNVPADELTMELSLISHRSTNQSSPTKQDSILDQEPKRGASVLPSQAWLNSKLAHPTCRRLLFYSYSSWTVGTFPVATLLQRGGAVYLIKQVESGLLFRVPSYLGKARAARNCLKKWLTQLFLQITAHACRGRRIFSCQPPMPVPVNMSNYNRNSIWWSEDLETALRWLSCYLTSKISKKL